jgi:hypothetical protein
VWLALSEVRIRDDGTLPSYKSYELSYTGTDLNKFSTIIKDGGQIPIRL